MFGFINNVFSGIGKISWKVTRAIPIIGDAAEYFRVNVLDGCAEGDFVCDGTGAKVLDPTWAQYFYNTSATTKIGTGVLGLAAVSALTYFAYKKTKPQSFEDVFTMLLKVGSTLVNPAMKMLIWGLESVADRDVDRVDMIKYKQDFPGASINDQAKARQGFKQARMEQLKTAVQDPRCKLALFDAAKKAHQDATKAEAPKGAYQKEAVKKSSLVDNIGQILAKGKIYKIDGVVYSVDGVPHDGMRIR